MKNQYLFRLVNEDGIPLLPMAYPEHRFSDFFIYGCNGYMDVYNRETYSLVLPAQKFQHIHEFDRKFFLVCEDDLWGAYRFDGTLLISAKFEDQDCLISWLVLNCY